jgi:hypothetical protein
MGFKYQLRIEWESGNVDFAELPCGKWEWDSEDELRMGWDALMLYVNKQKRVASYFITRAWEWDSEVIWDSNDGN